jgi:hypothetical protein
MSTQQIPKVFSPASPWHPSHKLKGYLQYHRLGPSGRLKCVACGGELWANCAEFGPRCGGSIEYDSRIAKPCRPRSQP